MSNAVPLSLARPIGVAFVFLLILGPVCLMWIPTLTVVPGDALATAEQIREQTTVFRFGLVGELLIVFIELGMTGALYLLFVRVHPLIAWTALIARAAMLSIQSLGVVVGIAMLSATPDLFATLLALRTGSVWVWQAIFAVHCIALGLLIFRSDFVPKSLGALMGFAGLGYLVAGLGPILAPQHAAIYDAVVSIAGFIGEIPFFAWLIFKGPRDRPLLGDLEVHAENPGLVGVGIGDEEKREI